MGVAAPDAAVETPEFAELIHPRAIPTVAGWRGAVREFERIWLGLTRAPLAERLAAHDWRPDLPHRYCRRCGSTAGPHDSDGLSCSWCRNKNLPWERMVRLGEFKGVLREVIHDVKFSRWRRVGHDVGRLLGQSIDSQLESESINRDRAVLVPVPMSIARRLSRGIDHATVIARGASEVTGLPLVQALHRRHSTPQTRLSAAQRRTNVATSFLPVRGIDLGGMTVILVDDVTTTRATLQAATGAIALGHKELRQYHGRIAPRVWASVLGVTPQGAPNGS